MRKLVVAISLLVIGLFDPSAAIAGEAETIAAVNQAADALDKAFERQDAAAIDRLTTDDHFAVTPYYGAPQTLEEQIATLSDLKYEQTNLEEPKVTLLADDVALRTFTAELKGSFKGRPIPSPVFISGIFVKTGSGWQESFYQVTELRPGSE